MSSTLLSLRQYSDVVSLDRKLVDSGNIQLEAMLDILNNRYMVKVSSCFYGRDKVVETTFSYPANFWQHFKQDFAPKWLLKRFPVKTKEEIKRTKVTELFPDIIAERYNYRTIYYLETIDETESKILTD